MGSQREAENTEGKETFRESETVIERERKRQ